MITAGQMKKNGLATLTRAEKGSWEILLSRQRRDVGKIWNAASKRARSKTKSEICD
jgi:hypothetical protein